MVLGTLGTINLNILKKYMYIKKSGLAELTSFDWMLRKGNFHAHKHQNSI